MKRIIPVLLPVLLLVLCQQAQAATTANSEYACVPPYLTQNAKPNINLVLDYTRSMLGPVYISCSVDTTTGLTTNCDSNDPAAESYDSTNNYYGYFKSDLYYSYNSSGYWEENSGCTNTNRIGTIGTTASDACLSGNILNFATATRVNVLRKILTGGRLNTTTNVYTAEGANYVFTDSTTHCKFTLAGTSTTVRTLKLENGSATSTCSLLGGAASAATYSINNQTTTPEEATGVVQSLYPGQVDLELSVFNTNVGAAYRVGKNKNISEYVNAINTETPIQLTNTGTALTEAKNYFRQSGMTAANTTLMVSKNDPTKDPYTDPGPVAAPCRKSFVLLISDGQWNSGSDPVIPAYYMHMNDLRTDTNMPGQQSVTTYAVYAFGDDVQGRNAMINTAMWGGFSDRDGNNAPYPFSSVSDTQRASGTYNPFGSNKDSRTYPSSTTTFPISACDPTPTGTWTAACAEWDRDKTGLPYNFFEGWDGHTLQEEIVKGLNGILGRVTSGTAASVMGNNDNSGSSLLQVLFYPEKTFESGSKASWIGEMQSFWYFADPSLKNITIREDSDNDKKLNLSQDKIIEFAFDGTDTLVNRFADATGDGAKDTPSTAESTVTTDDVNALWRAGKKLWARNPAERTIFTSDPTLTAATKLNFTSDNATVAKLYPYMDTNSTQAIDIIKYVRGIDASTTYRNRTVTIDSAPGVWKLGDIIHSTPKLLSEVRLNSYNLRQPGGYSDKSYDQYIKSKDYNRRGAAYVGANDGMLHAFELGSNFDGTTKGTVAEIKDASGGIDNLGKELWAFIPKNTLPYLQYLLNPSYQHIYMVDATPLLVDASINPTKYTKSDGTTITCDDATYSQCVKQTDVKPSTQLANYNLTQEKGGTSWRTLLLGSTGMGGAVSPVKAKISGLEDKIGVTGNGKYYHCASCDFTAAGFTVGTIFKASGFVDHNIFCVVTKVEANKLTCEKAAMHIGNESNVATAVLQQLTVKTPIKDPKDSTKGYGYSSVFALDVTDPVTSDLAGGSYPKLLWEFTDPRLGFTTVTPAIVRIRDAAETTTPGLERNGKWYAVIASGPTGPIENGWFLGLSDKKLTIFVLDLKSGELVRTFSSAATAGINTQFTLPVDAPAFAGSLSGATTDTDKHKSSLAGSYSDDAVYIGYTRANSPTAPTAWDKGGVVRLLTYNDPNPANWSVSTLVDGIGPVTSAVTKLQDATASQLWLYFGTGRYYTKDDDPSNVQALYGLKDPCFSTGNIFSGSPAAPCTTMAGTSALDNRTTASNDLVTNGWYINLLAGNGTTTNSKRVITDTLANTNGVVNFTTFVPSKEVCSYGGETSVWAVKYNTGGNTLVGDKQKLKGQLLMQLSTGAFQQVDISSAFTRSDNRETPAYKGVPPSSPPVITGNTNHFPTKRFLHIQER